MQQGTNSINAKILYKIKLESTVSKINKSYIYILNVTLDIILVIILL